MCLSNLVHGLEGPRHRFYVAIPRQHPYWDQLESYLGKDRLFELPFRKFSISCLFALRGFVRRNRIGVVHSHGKGAGVFSRMLRLIGRVSTVHTFHGMHHQVYKKRIVLWIYLLLERLMTRHLTNLAICVSDSERSLAEKLGILGKSTVVIRNGVKVDKRSASVHNQRHGPLRICTITRFDAEGAKGADIFVRVVRELVISVGTVEARVVGDGERKEEIFSLAESLGVSDHISFLGFRPNARELIREGGIFVSTSRWEGMPLAVLEAMAEGSAIVVTAVRGNTDAVRDGVDGLWARAENPADIAEKVLTLHRDGSLAKRLANQANGRAKAEFSILAMCNTTAHAYERFASDRHAAAATVGGTTGSLE